MDIQEKQKEGFITLKEASLLSGYSSDYLGQLIRKGKLEGKQVYANVAWMTTREAIDSYVASENSRNKNPVEEDRAPLRARALTLALDQRGSRALRALLTFVGVCAAFGLLFEFYMLSVFVDHGISARAEERTKETALAATALTAVSGDHGEF